jgi:hypothetical protein
MAMMDSVIIAAPLLIAALVMAVRFVGCGLSISGILSYQSYQSTVKGTAGLVSFWKLNDTTTSPPTAVDSEDSNNGTYEGAGIAVNPSSGAVTLKMAGLVSSDASDSDNFGADFDGNTGLVKVKSAPNINPPTFAVEALVAPGVIDPSNPRVIVSSFDGTGQAGYTLALDNTDFVATVGTGSGIQTVKVHADAQISQSHYVAMTYDGTNLELYVDPQATDTDSKNQFIKSDFVNSDPNHTMYNEKTSANYKPQTASALEIGASTDSGRGVPFQGEIQNVAIYNPPLGFNDIVNHYYIYLTGNAVAPLGTSAAELSGSGTLKVSASFPKHASSTTPFVGTTADPGVKHPYPIPYWCNYIDLILLGGGAGGAAGTSGTGAGGQGGQWKTYTLQRSNPPLQTNQIDWTTTSIAITVGGGGNAGVILGATPTGGSPTTATATGWAGGSAAGGTGANGMSQTGAGPNPEILSFNGATYTGGAAQTTAGALGNGPGGGGGGGAFLTNGGGGAAGGAWVVARQ